MGLRSLSAKSVSILILFSLIGCAPQVIQNFTPFAVEVKDTTRFESDLYQCREYAREYLSEKGGLNPYQMAQEGATAGFSDLGYSIVSPYAPALGALGGASGEAVSELGLNSEQGRKVVTICLHDKGQESNSYHIYDPHQ